MKATPLRVALFGSFYRGFYVLQELIKLQDEEKIKIVGVATDDPSQPFVSPNKRVWQYPHTKAETFMVQKLAQEHQIPTYTGRVKSDEFYEIFEKQWEPDICYMATFGQLISPRLFRYPKLGFFNLHPSNDKIWPSYIGGNPFQAMLDNGEKYAVITLHEVNEEFDNGRLINVSERVYFPYETTVTDLHKLTATTAAGLAKKHLCGVAEKLDH